MSWAAPEPVGVTTVHAPVTALPGVAGRTRFRLRLPLHDPFTVTPHAYAGEYWLPKIHPAAARRPLQSPPAIRPPVLRHAPARAPAGIARCGRCRARCHDGLDDHGGDLAPADRSRREI